MSEREKTAHEKLRYLAAYATMGTVLGIALGLGFVAAAELTKSNVLLL